MEQSRDLALLTVFMLIVGGGGQLIENFYMSSCPNVEAIVRQAVFNKFSQTFVTAPATLRLFFHDCFVEGCDASIMIASSAGDAEKDASDNISLAGDGFDTVVKAKQAVEQFCPGVVSCADIVALAARDVVVLVGGPSFNVELGRRDGLISKVSRVKGNLPEPEFNLTQLNNIFSKNNLSQNDMIALSGAHTIGFSHCDRFAKRLYSFSSSSSVDPTLDTKYASQLMESCPKNFDPSVAVNMDPSTPRSFDNLYYQNLVDGKGIFISDQTLFTDERSKSTIIQFAKSAQLFNGAFVSAMKKLGRIGVKSGKEGEIRRDCTSFN